MPSRLCTMSFCGPGWDDLTKCKKQYTLPTIFSKDTIEHVDCKLLTVPCSCFQGFCMRVPVALHFKQNKTKFCQS